jgi:hypothetical protein
MCTPFAAEVYLDLLWIALVPSDCNATDRRNGRRLPLGEIDPIDIFVEFIFDFLSTVEFRPRLFNVRIT